MSDTVYGGICPYCGDFVKAKAQKTHIRPKDKRWHLQNECGEYDDRIWYEAKKEDGEVQKI